MRQLIALITIAALALTSCKSYTEGPGLTFRKAETRITNSWVVDRAYDDDGAEITSNFDDQRMLFREDGVLKIEEKVTGSFQTQAEGTWQFLNDKEAVATVVNYTFGTSEDTLQILKLKNDEFWYTRSDGYELHLVPESE